MSTTINYKSRSGFATHVEHGNLNMASLSPALADEYFNRALSDECLPMKLGPIELSCLDKEVLDERCLDHSTLLPIIPTADYPSPSFQTVLARLRTQLKVLNQPHYVLSLSGGVDSMTHLMLLNILRHELSFTLSACHIRHSSRPDEALKEEQWVQWVCSLLNVPVYSHHVEVNRPHGETKSAVTRDDFEEFARKIRFCMYRKTYFITKPESVESIPHIIIGHHIDDVDENRLAELGKLTLIDIDGMGVSESMVDCVVIRPLCCDTRKDELIEAAQSIGLPYMHNSTPTWSRRGWIRAVIDGIANKQNLLELLESAGQLSSRLGLKLREVNAKWLSDEKGVASFKAVCKNKRQSVELIGVKMKIASLFTAAIPRVQPLVEQFSKLVSEIAETWNPAVIAASGGQSCPIQHVRAVEMDRLESLILGEAIMMNFQALKSALKSQIPGRTPLNSFCEAAAVTQRSVLGVLLHKHCPAYYFKESGSLFLFENHNDLSEICGNKTEVMTAAVARMVVEYGL